MADVAPLSRYRLTEHAQFEMARRGIEENEVAQTLSEPEQIIPVRPGRVVYQSHITKGHPPKVYLLRVFVDIDRDPPEVVTAYLTTKIAKYWKTGL